MANSAPGLGGNCHRAIDVRAHLQAAEPLDIAVPAALRARAYEMIE